MKVLVTGGAGYIGSVAVEELLKHGEEVVVFDNLVQGHRAAVHPDAAFVEGDLLDKTAVDAVMAEHKPDAIMHFASHTSVGESVDDPFKYLGENVVAGKNLMESAVEHGVLRFILSSTANLFDDPERMPIDENERIVPGSPYGESKYILERFLYWLERTKGMKYACFRYFNASGATELRGEDHDPEFNLIPLVLQVALGQRQDIKIFGDDWDTPDGTCIRDYIHVIDLAAAHIAALHKLDPSNPNAKSRTYNLGNGKGYSVQEVIDVARQITDHAIPAEVVGRRAGDPAILIASSERAHSELGWQPQYDLHAIVESAWKWHSAHPQGYGDR